MTFRYLLDTMNHGGYMPTQDLPLGNESYVKFQKQLDQAGVSKMEDYYGY